MHRVSGANGDRCAAIVVSEAQRRARAEWARREAERPDPKAAPPIQRFVEPELVGKKLLERAGRMLIGYQWSGYCTFGEDKGRLVRGGILIGKDPRSGWKLGVPCSFFADKMDLYDGEQKPTSPRQSGESRQAPTKETPDHR